MFILAILEEYNKLKKLLIFFLILTTNVFAQTARKYSNEFLNIGVDAAAFGMGNAVVAISDDVNSGYWNPAGLLAIEDYQGSLMHAEYFAGIGKYDYAGFAMPIDDYSALGINLIRFGVDDILNTTELIDANGNIDYNRIQLFSAADYALTFSYARQLNNPNLKVGFNTKIIHRIIGKFASSWGFGLDAGIQFENNSWKFGVMARDITTTFNSWSINKSEFEKIKNAIPGENQELPETTELTLPKLQIGVAKEFEFNRDLILTTELDINTRFTKTNDIISSKIISIDPSFGFQLSYINLVYLRGGVSNFQNETQFDGSKSISIQPNFGVGFKYRGIQIDYALSNIGNVGNVLYSNIFSLKIDFQYFR